MILPAVLLSAFKYMCVVEMLQSFRTQVHTELFQLIHLNQEHSTDQMQNTVPVSMHDDMRKAKITIKPPLNVQTVIFLINKYLKQQR